MKNLQGTATTDLQKAWYESKETPKALVRALDLTDQR